MNVEALVKQIKCAVFGWLAASLTAEKVSCLFKCCVLRGDGRLGLIVKEG